MYRVSEFAAEHHGIFDLRAARGVGITYEEVRAAARRGDLICIHRGVFRFAGAPWTWEGELLAACWAAGHRGFASHQSAAELRVLPGGSRAFVVVTCPRWRRAHHPAIVVHESTNWDSRDVDTINGIPVSSAALTLLQLAALPGWRTLEMALERCLRTETTSIAAIDDLLRRYAQRGRPGIRKLRRLVRDRDPLAAPTDSERETMLLQAIRRHGLPEPVRQHIVRDANGLKVGTVDLAYPGARIAIEYDSDQFHTGRVAVARDSERRHRMVSAGWLPITVIRTDLNAGGRLVCRALGAALRDRSGSIPAPLSGH
jgi:hypothetical protein